MMYNSSLSRFISCLLLLYIISACGRKSQTQDSNSERSEEIAVSAQSSDSLKYPDLCFLDKEKITKEKAVELIQTEKVHYWIIDNSKEAVFTYGENARNGILLISFIE